VDRLTPFPFALGSLAVGCWLLDVLPVFRAFRVFRGSPAPNFCFLLSKFLLSALDVGCFYPFFVYFVYFVVHLPLSAFQRFVIAPPPFSRNHSVQLKNRN
jgi:hypothetical protein